jgi:hypothetical protein
MKDGGGAPKKRRMRTREAWFLSAATERGEK